MANIISHTSCPVSMNHLLIVYRRHILWTPSTYRDRVCEKKYITFKILALPGILGYECTPFYHGNLLNLNAPKVSADEISLLHKNYAVDIVIQFVMCTEKIWQKLLTSSVLTISFAMKRRIFSGTDGFPNLPCRNFIQRGRSTGTVPWNLRDYQNQLTSWNAQAYQTKKPPAWATQVSL